MVEREEAEKGTDNAGGPHNEPMDVDDLAAGNWP